jgi:biopolymer transport protein ExbD
MRKSFLKREQPSTEMNLQITSMADIFTILLVFLLKSFSVGAFQIAPSAAITLPQAKAQERSVQALRVEVGQNAVFVDGRAIARISNFSFSPSDLEKDGVSRSLVSSLKKVEGQKIVVIADQRAPYATIKTVLASAAVQGYTDFKLAVTNVE